MKPDTARRQALDDRILATLRDQGPLTTGALTEACGPYHKTRRANHGTYGSPFERCPSCKCVEVVEVRQRWASPMVRARLKSLERQGLVAMLRSPTPNNHGGNVWLLQ
jgi:hypothetical protein